MTGSDSRDGGGERIARRMARAGVASRRAAEAMIAEGRVAVNGEVIESPALNVTPRDRITVDGVPLATPEGPRLWRYYKPIGLVTSERDEKGRETVFSRLPEDMPRVVSVGRLDLNSEGLLLLTNDGALKRRLELPSTGWLRKYRVRAHGAATDATLEPLRRGISVDGERFQPMTVTVDRQQGSNVWLTVALREGRNREVRRALDAVGLSVNRLIRVSYGPFQLGDLEPGQVEEVRPKAVREQLGLEPAPQRAPGGGAAGRTAAGSALNGAGTAEPKAGRKVTRGAPSAEEAKGSGRKVAEGGASGSGGARGSGKARASAGAPKGYLQKSQAGQEREGNVRRPAPTHSQKLQDSGPRASGGKAPDAGKPASRPGVGPSATSGTRPGGKPSARPGGKPSAGPRKPLTPGPRRPK